MSEICWPGNTIPKWFKHQSEKSSVSIELSSNNFDDQTFLGFVFCVVIDFKDCNLQDGDLKIFCQTRFTMPGGFHSAMRWSWIWHLKYHDRDNAWMDKTHANSPHVFLFYKNMSPRDFGLGNYDDESVNVTFEFYPEDSNGYVNSRNSTVERCGIRLAYASDLKKLGFICEEDEEDDESIVVDEDMESIVDEESIKAETDDSEDEDENEPQIVQKRNLISWRCLREIWGKYYNSLFAIYYHSLFLKLCCY